MGVAQWKEDECWYRAEITKIESDEKVLVKFIEYGNSDFTCLGLLKPFETKIDGNGKLVLNEKEAKADKPENEKKLWKEGEKCVAKWNEDECWYRAEITQIESDDKVIVKFTEYGNSDFTSLAMLKPFETKIDENGKLVLDEKGTKADKPDNEKKPWTEGDKCVAKWNEDECWYRAKITKIESDEKVLVKFIEY